MKKNILNPLGGLICKSLKDSNFIVLRHAQSTFNHHAEELKKKKHILSKDDYKKYHNELRFSETHIDSLLTEKGKLECREAGEQLKNVRIKYVITSPMRRAMQTTQMVLDRAGHKPEIVVFPYLSEKVEDNCDLVSDIMHNMKLYSDFNWDLVTKSNLDPLYQLLYCDVWPSNTKTDKTYHQIGTEHKHLGPLKPILKWMEKLAEEEKYIESSRKTYERLSLLKDFLKKFAVEKKLAQDEKVLIVAHSVLLKHLGSKYVDKDTLEPEEPTILQNCEYSYLTFK